MSFGWEISILALVKEYITDRNTENAIINSPLSGDAIFSFICIS